MYTDQMVMGWMVDEYSIIKRAQTPAAVTGKPLSLGGSLGRDTATADGAFHVLKTLAPKLAEAAGDDEPELQTVAIQGFGNAGARMAELCADAGYTVVAVVRLHPRGLRRGRPGRGRAARGQGRRRRAAGRRGRRARPRGPAGRWRSTC